MKLKEFVDNNGNKINISKPGSNSSQNASGKISSGYKKRFEKLLAYAQAHKNASIIKATVNSISDNEFSYSERIDGGYSVYDREISVYIGSTTEAWRLKIYINSKIDDDIAGQGWPELLKTLRYYITVPVTTTLEYKELLTEWVDTKGNKINITSATPTNKVNLPDQTYRFERLVAQIQADKLCRIQVNNLTETVLEITTGNHVKIKIERLPQFPNYVLKIGNHRKSYDDYDDLLDALIEEGIMANTDLCEWVDNNGNKINLPRASTSTSTKSSYKEKLQKLLDYHLANDYNIKNKSSKGTIDLLSEDNDKALFKYRETWDDSLGDTHETITCASYFKKDSTWWILRFVDNKQTVSTDGSKFDELIRELNKYLTLPPLKSSEYQNLLESLASIAEEFKIYENLWN